MPARNLPPPAPLSERELERAMELNVAAGFLGMVWLAVAYGMPLPLLMESVKANGVQLGMLSAVRQFSMLAQLPSAFLVERLRRRKPFWACCAITQRLIWFTPALLPILLPERRDLWAVAIIAALGISDILGNGATSPWFSWMADLLPPERAGRFWGTRQRVLSLAVLISSLIFGIILDELAGHGFLGFQIVFGLAALFGTADILVHMCVHEPEPARATVRESFWKRVAVPLRQANFRRLTLGMSVWTAAVTMPGYGGGLPSFFSVVYLKENFGVTYGQASWVFIASALSAILLAPRIGHLIDRQGARKTILWMMAIGPLFTLCWLLVTPGHWRLAFLSAVPIPQPIFVIGAASLVVGGMYSGVSLCQVRLTQMFTTPSGRTVAMGVHWSLVGLTGTLGSLLAGWLKDHLVFSGASLLPGLAPFSYFQVLILVQVALVWGIALPVIRRISP